MKRLLLKTTSVVLVASLALSFAACSKNNKGGSDRAESRSGKTISADSPWFDGKLTDVDIPIDNNMEVEYTYPRLAGVDDNYVVVLTSGYYKMPNGNDIDWENFNYNEYAINLVSIIDRKTNESINTLDLTSDLPKNAYLDTVTYRNGKICAYTTTYNDLTYEIRVAHQCGSVSVPDDFRYRAAHVYIEHFILKTVELAGSICHDFRLTAEYLDRSRAGAIRYIRKIVRLASAVIQALCTHHLRIGQSSTLFLA